MNNYYVNTTYAPLPSSPSNYSSWATVSYSLDPADASNVVSTQGHLVKSTIRARDEYISYIESNNLRSGWGGSYTWRSGEMNVNEGPAQNNCAFYVKYKGQWINLKDNTAVEQAGLDSIFERQTISSQPLYHYVVLYVWENSDEDKYRFGYTVIIKENSSLEDFKDSTDAAVIIQFLADINSEDTGEYVDTDAYTTLGGTSPLLKIDGRAETSLTDYFYTTNSPTAPQVFESGYSLYNFKNMYETYNGSPVNNRTYFWPKPSGLPYTYLQYYNYNAEYTNITSFYNENIPNGVWMRRAWRPYLRKVVFDTQTPGWYAVNVTEGSNNTVQVSATRYDTEDLALENATSSNLHVIIGVILQASGGQGGPGDDNNVGIGHGGGGGGGGAYVEALVNCYTNRIVINLGNSLTYGSAVTNSHIQVYNSIGSVRRAAVGVETGYTGSKGTWGTGGTGGNGGRITYVNSGAGDAWAEFPLTFSTQRGDGRSERWLTEDNSANSIWEDWSTSLIYLGTCVPGGSGGSHKTSGASNPNPGNPCAATGTYFVAGVPRGNLASTTTPEGMRSAAAQRFTSSCGTLVGSSDSYTRNGSGGGASYMGSGSAGVSGNVIASGSFGGGGGGGRADSSSAARAGGYGGTGYLALLI